MHMTPIYQLSHRLSHCQETTALHHAPGGCGPNTINLYATNTRRATTEPTPAETMSEGESLADVDATAIFTFGSGLAILGFRDKRSCSIALKCVRCEAEPVPHILEYGVERSEKASPLLTSRHVST